MSLELLQDDGFTLTHKYGDLSLDVSMEPSKEDQPAYLTDETFNGMFNRIVRFAHKRMQDETLTAVEQVVEKDRSKDKKHGDCLVHTDMEDLFPGFVLHLSVDCRLVIAYVSKYHIETELANSLMTPVDTYVDALSYLEMQQNRPRIEALATATPKRQLVEAVRSVLRDFRGRGD